LGVNCVSAEDRAGAIEFCAGLDARNRGGLSIDEAAAIRLYTGNALYGALNERLRIMARERKLQYVHLFHGIARLIQSALLKLPASPEGTVFRGVHAAKANLDLGYEDGLAFEWGQFTSCSTKGGVAEEFAAAGSVFAVRCFGGRCLKEFSMVPKEDEVTLPIGTRLRVTGGLTQGSMPIFLEEVHKSGRTAAEEATAAAKEATAAADKATAEATRLRQELAALTTGAGVAGAQGVVDAPAGSYAESDAAALRALRAECPELREMWDEGKPVWAWEGLTFSGAGGAHAGRVVNILLQGKGLTGSVPAALGQLTALTRLVLTDNQLTGGVPAALGGLTALTWLCLDNNHLTGEVPEELGALTALEVLYLNGNYQLTSVPAAWRRGGALEESGCDNCIER